ncbi:hypothetical protein PI124_g23415 [Phytophthora idaei]|nr:hypothetical protein PI125_g25718 [Phytophthora idaei]KAG3124012.1 hypothetical protein PI126_g23440 [Phytophthora idaei]KAG3231488.1 hypothetical protein PI124_g23415 [Phytophthora idaei]
MEGDKEPPGEAPQGPITEDVVCKALTEPEVIGLR